MPNFTLIISLQCEGFITFFSQFGSEQGNLSINKTFMECIDTVISFFDVFLALCQSFDECKIMKRKKIDLEKTRMCYGT